MNTETTAQVGPMTTDELRDWHKRHRHSIGVDTGHPCDFSQSEKDLDYKHCRACDKWGTHPFPPTLDGAASAMPPEGKWSRGDGVWWWDRGDWATTAKCDDTGDEIHDRYLLAKLAKEAMGQGSMKENA